MRPRQKVLALLIGVALITLSVQVVAATTECNGPTCKVVYNSNVMHINAPASAPQDTTHAGPLSLLDPTTVLTSQNQVNILDIVLKLL